MFLKIFNLIFWVGMIFFLGGITLMLVMDPEVTSDEFCWDGTLYISS